MRELLRSAPFDDEPLTPSEVEALEKSHEYISADELKRVLEL